MADWAVDLEELEEVASVEVSEEASAADLG